MGQGAHPRMHSLVRERCEHKHTQRGLSTQHGLRRTEPETSCPACRSAALHLRVSGGLEQEDDLIQPPLHLDRCGERLGRHAGCEAVVSEV